MFTPQTRRSSHGQCVQSHHSFFLPSGSGTVWVGMHFQVGLLGSLSWEKSDSASDQIPRALCLMLYGLLHVIFAGFFNMPCLKRQSENSHLHYFHHYSKWCQLTKMFCVCSLVCSLVFFSFILELLGCNGYHSSRIYLS